MKYHILTLFLAFILTGCSLIDDSLPECPAGDSSESITLSFKMISPNIGTTRADSQHQETDSQWPQFEDLIDINDFAFYIFLDNAEEKPLVMKMKMSELADSSDPASMITGSFGAYTVTTVIPKRNLEALLGRDLSPDSSDAVDFRIVLLANVNAGMSSDDAGYTDYNSLAPVDAANAGSDLSKVTTYSQFLENIDKIGFNLNYVYNPMEGDSSIDGLYKGAIPMFGMVTAHTTEALLYKSRPDERIYLGDIYMMRSLAKIVVIDNAERIDEEYPYVSSVTVEGITDMSYPVPALASYTNGQQIHDTRFLQRSSDTSNVSFSLGYLGENTHSRGTVRFGYLPEQPIQYGNPVIKITVQLDPNRQQEYSVPMGGSADYPLTPSEPGAGGFGANIIRNHIYTLNVNRISVGTPAEITVDVKEWDSSSFNLDFTESVIIQNKLQWTPGSYEAKDDATGVVVVKPWTTTAEGESWSPMTGTFGIQSPVGATWTAYLISTAGDNEAFAFLDRNTPDENGNPSLVPSVSGVIDGKNLSTLTIVSTDPDPAEQNRALLQIVVRVGDGASGSVIEADLTPENTSYKYYTIVQNTL